MVMARKDLSTVTMREVLNSMFASSTSICSDKVKRPMDKTGERREHVWERVGHCDLTLTLPNVASTPRVHGLNCDKRGNATLECFGRSMAEPHCRPCKAEPLL